MQNSTIEWCDHTFNPWWGCLKVSEGCRNCYAEGQSKRYGHAVWGPAATTARRTFGDKHWSAPLTWNRAARESGERKRVFCGSMCDWAEDHPIADRERPRLFELIEQTEHLDYLLLTKRIDRVLDLIPARWRTSPPRNVWYGTSVEDQASADARIPHLLRIPTAVRFLSCEPLLGPVDLTPWLTEWVPPGRYSLNGHRGWLSNPPLHWIIAGGESGHGARPMHPVWARSLRDQCVAAGVAFFLKQWGQHGPPTAYNSGELAFDDGQRMCRYRSKGDAGRELDGRTHDAFPH